MSGDRGMRHAGVRRRGMRLASVVSEAWRNLASGTARAATWGLLAALVTGGLAAADVASITGLERHASELRSAGAATYRLAATGAVDGERCHNLTVVPGVLGAGAVRDAGEVTDLAMPGAALPAREITPGVLDVLGAAPRPGPGVAVTDSIASSLGLSPGEQLVTSHGPVPVTAVYRYPEDGRIRELGYSVLQPVPAAGMFDACWVSLWPMDERIVPLLRATVTSSETDLQVDVTQANQSLGRSFDGAREFDRRPTAWAWLLAAVIGLLLGATAAWSRRLEHAAALHAGVPKPAMVATALLEAATWAAAAAVLAGCATWLVTVWLGPSDPLPAVTAGLRIVLAGSAAIVLGSAVATAATRERRLFRYFKSR